MQGSWAHKRRRLVQNAILYPSLCYFSPSNQRHTRVNTTNVLRCMAQGLWPSHLCRVTMVQVVEKESLTAGGNKPVATHPTTLPRVTPAGPSQTRGTPALLPRYVRVYKANRVSTSRPAQGVYVGGVGVSTRGWSGVCSGRNVCSRSVNALEC